MSSTRQFIQPLSSLAPSERIAQLIAYAHNQRKPLIVELESGTGYEPQLAALVAAATQDTAWIQAHIAHPVPSVQFTALRAATPTNVPDQVISQALQGDISATTRTSLLCYGLIGRPHLAAQLFPGVHASWGDASALDVLQHCSAEVVASTLPELLPSVSPTQWRGVAQAHPDVLLDTLAQDWKRTVAAGISPGTWWIRYSAAINVLLKLHPTEFIARRILDLIDASELNVFPSDLLARMGVFVRVDPGRVAGYCTRGLVRIWHLSSNKKRYLIRSLGTTDLVDFARWLSTQHFLKQFLRYFSWPVRGQVYKQVFTSHPPKYIDQSLIDVLPRDVAIEIATRVLANPTMVDSPAQQKLQWLAYLPPSTEATQAAIRAGLRAPNPTDRLSAYSAWVSNVARTGDAALWTETASQLAKQIQNEQQRVREPLLDHLRSVPVTLWSTAARSALYQMASDAINAPDWNSSHCSKILVPLTLDIFTAYDDSVEWTRSMLKVLKLSDPIRSPWRFSPCSRMPLTQIQVLWSMVEAQATEQVQEGSDEILWDFCQVLKQRALEVPGIASLVRDVILHGESELDFYLDLYLRSPATRLTRVREVLAHDKSLANFPLVANVIVRSLPMVSQEVLTTPPVGRSLKAKDAKEWVLPCDVQHLWLLTTEQYALYLAQLDRVLRSNSYGKRPVLRRLTQIPGGPALAAKWLDASAQDIRNVEQALYVLGADPTQMDCLLSYATKQEARVAMRAAARAAKAASPSQIQRSFTPLLQSNSKAKISSRKMALYVLARYVSLDEATRVFATILNRRDVHRDVLVTMVSCARQYMLGTQTGWDVLHKVVAPLPEEQPSTDIDSLDPSTKERIDDMATVRLALTDLGVFSVPYSRRSEFAGLLLQLVRSSNSCVVQEVLSQLSSWVMYNPEAYEALFQAATDFSTARSSVVGSEAVASVVNVADTEAGRTVLIRTLEHLLHLSGTEQQEGKLELPVTQRIESIARDLHTKVGKSRFVRAGWACVATVLQRGTDFDMEVCKLMCHLLDMEQLASSPTGTVVRTSLATLAQQAAEGQVPHVWLLLPSLTDELDSVLTLVPGALTVLAMKLSQMARLRCSDNFSFKDLVHQVDLLSQRSTVGALMSLEFVKVFGRETECVEARQRIVLKLRTHPVRDVRVYAKRQ